MIRRGPGTCQACGVVYERTPENPVYCCRECFEYVNRKRAAYRKRVIKAGQVRCALCYVPMAPGAEARCDECREWDPLLERVSQKPARNLCAWCVHGWPNGQAARGVECRAGVAMECKPWSQAIRYESVVKSRYDEIVADGLSGMELVG